MPKIFKEKYKNNNKNFFASLLSKLEEHNIFLLSGGLTFFVFVCIIPLVFIIFYFAGSTLDSYIESSKIPISVQIENFLNNTIPVAEHAEKLKDFIFQCVEETRNNKTHAGYFGFFGLLLASTGLFSAIRTVLDIVYKVNTKRHIIKAKLRDLLTLVIVILFFLMSAILPSFEIIKFIIEKLDLIKLPMLDKESLEIFLHLNSSTGYKATYSLLSFLTTFILLFCCYYFVPQDNIPKRTALISALFGTIFWALAKQVFRIYLEFRTWNEIYGTYFLFIALAFWVYYSCFVFILSAEIGQVLREKYKK